MMSRTLLVILFVGLPLAFVLLAIERPCFTFEPQPHTRIVTDYIKYYMRSKGACPSIYFTSRPQQ